MEGPLQKIARSSGSSDTKDVLLFGPSLVGVERSLLRWGYLLRPIPPSPRPRGPLPGGDTAVVVIVDGSQPGAPEVLQIAYESQLPSVLVRAPSYLPGEKYAGCIYRNVPGPEEIRRAVNRLVSCPVPSRTTPIPSAPFLQFLRSRFGLTFPPRRSAEIRDAVLQRMTALRLPTASSYLERLERSQPGDREPDHLLSSLLVQETYIYRTPSHFTTIQDQYLSQFLARSGREVIRAWSAGCSTGEEAYSLGALLCSRIPPSQVEVIGSDVSLQALDQARFGSYSGYSIREEIPDAVRRHFELRSGTLTASPELRRRVHFEYINLAAWAEGEGPGPDGDFDLIFCRNVLLYFAPECSRRILQKLATRLRPGGLLFLGPSETVLGGETDLQIRSGQDCFFLEKPGASVALATPPIAPPSAPVPRPLSRPPSPREPLGPAPPPWEKRKSPPSGLDSRQQERALERGFRLLDQEDFPAARREFQFVQRVDPASQGARLGLLFLEANDGNYRMASAGTKLLAEEGAMIPELFYLRGILADQDGDPDEALLHFQRALFLDPNCLMGRLKLAEIHARTGDRRGSSREALNLLEQLRKLEPGSLVPLSGGLSREALEALCLGLLSDEKGR